MSSLERYEALTGALSRLPGVGRRSAERMAMALLRRRERLLDPLVAALREAADGLALCDWCGAVTGRDTQPCRMCGDPAREQDRLCVVENPEDVAVIEASGAFRGRYHCLHGRLAPTRAEEPDPARLERLMERVERERTQEIILALSTDMEGDITANFLAERLMRKRLHVTRLAFGLPAGSGLAWSDPVTVGRALRGRQEL